MKTFNNFRKELAEENLDEIAKWRKGPPLLRSRAQEPVGLNRNVAKHPDEKRTWVPSDSMYGPGEKIPVQRIGRNDPDPLSVRADIKSKSKNNAKTNRTLKQTIQGTLHKKSNLPK